jgi:branched-chain amino acid transport system substrate-binding protein
MGLTFGTKVLRAALVLAASLGALALSSGAQAAPTCKDGTIKVGAVSTITGPADFSEVPKAAKATFDAINAKGGLNGCKIDYTIEDDKADPAAATQAARDLVDNKDVVVLTGSASLLDCAVNAGYYGQKKIMSIQGLGVDPACFNAPNISPVNVGPYTLSTAVLYYATNTLKLDKLCADFIIIGGTQEAYKKAIADWEKLTGKKILYIDLTMPIQGDYTPYILKARDAGCQGVIFNAVEPGVVQLMKTAEAQKIKGVDWLFLSPGYTDQVAKTLAQTDQPIYVGTEWEPYTDVNAPANKDWRAVMTAAGQPLTAFTQGGYESATILIDVLKSIDGPVTRDSVAKALHTMKPMPNSLVGTPYYFGPDKKHASSRATKIVKLEAGKWVVETPQFVVLPEIKD